MRLRAQQSCPVLAKTLIGDSAAARSQSASAKTMFGDLPPSSSDTRLMSSAASFMIVVPTSVEPVKPIFRTSGWVASAWPASAPLPGNTCSTPSGRPASCASWPSISAVNGVSDAGLRTTELPAASAGAIFQQAMRNGKFHGVIAAMTPIGCRSVKSKPPRATGIVCPHKCPIAPA